MNISSVLFQTAAIGDYLFLILVVLASIIQAIAQNNKKKVLLEQEQRRIVQNESQVSEVIGQKPETMSGYDTPVKNIFNSIQKVLIPEFEEEQYNWGDDYAEAVTAEKNVKEAAESSDNSEEKLNPDVAEKHTVLFPQKSVTDIPAISRKSLIRDGFSLRKAVIYSEILNRKYT